MCSLRLRLITALAVGLALLGLVTPSRATEHIVNVSGTSFVPAVLDIQVGDTVTWINDGGHHNVVADDTSFTSGPASPDLWQFSHTFNTGGSWPYHCSQHVALGMVGTITVGGVFADGFESGDTGQWSQVFPPVRSDCNCYFSSDCLSGNRCDWGPGGPANEDICTWVDDKPDGVPGAGCNVPHVGPWGGDICDGVCSPILLGSALGWEDPELLLRGAALWAEALLAPAETGGGAPDPLLTQAALALPFRAPESTLALARQVVDVLMLSADPAFGPYFCHYEHHPDDPGGAPKIDLSHDPCRRHSARLAVEALLAEMRAPGSCAQVLERLPSVCLSWREVFAPRCPAGADTLACVEREITDTATFVMRPRNFALFLQRLDAEAGLGAAR